MRYNLARVKWRNLERRKTCKKGLAQPMFRTPGFAPPLYRGRIDHTRVFERAGLGSSQ